MRRLSLITVCLAIVGMLMPALSSAEDAGTYRPGQAYHSVAASSPMQCAAQCQGDAQCKGWNFVRPRQMSRTGVCEFNAQKVTPVPSPISVSGDNVTARTSHQIVSAGSRTVRVGSPSMPEPALQAMPDFQAMPAFQAMPSVQGRDVETAPVQAAAMPRRVVTAAPAAAQPPQMRIAHSLDEPAFSRPQPSPQMARHSAPQSMQSALAGGNSAAMAKPAQTHIQQPPYMRIQHYLDEPTAMAAYTAPHMNMQQPQTAPAQRAPVVMRHNLDEGMPRYEASRTAPQALQYQQPVSAPVNVPASYQAPQPMQQQPTQPMSAPKITLYPHPIAPTQAAQASTGLYGSLYDDVQVPLALTQQNTPSDPDVPIPTVRYIQTGPMSTAGLPMPYGR